MATAVIGLLMALSASSASALSIGLVWNGDYGTAAAEMEQVQRSGATVFRLPIDISRCNNGNEGKNWNECNGIFQAAWEHGITLQPYLVRSNSEGTRFLLSGDSGWTDWGNFSREVVEHYGINGSFWTGKSNPKPVTAWEVWNEENLPKNNPYLAGGKEGAQPQNYGKFLKYTAEKIQAGSIAKTAHGTEVIFGGLYMPAGEYYNSFLQNASAISGVPGSYQGVAIHPYAFQNGVTQMAERISDVRYGLDHNVAGGAGKPLWITELGWPVAGEGAPSVTEAQQASLLTESLNWIKANAATYNIPLVDWYNIRDLGGQTKWSYFSGLRDANGTYRPSWWAFEEETGAPKWPMWTEVAFQANTGFLYTYSQNGGAQYIPYGMMAGTSPSITKLPSGSYEIAFQANTGELFTYTPSTGVQGHPLKLKSGTSPSITTLSDGSYEVAFQSDTGFLYTYSQNTGAQYIPYGMKAGTSPSITALPNGSYEVAFQANTGELFTYTPSTGVQNLALGMMAGTSPSITTLPNGSYEAAFQANTGFLYTYSQNTGAQYIPYGMKAGTSPSITALQNSSYQVAIQVNNGELAIYSPSTGLHGTALGMMSGTSPSITTLPDGSYEAAFQANTGFLYTYAQNTGAQYIPYGMMAGTSPSIR